MVMGHPRVALTSPSPSFRLRCRSLNSLRLRRIFDMFDKNGDAMITVAEISQALGRLGLDADVAELESMTRSYIRPGNEGLAYEDFVALHESIGDAYFGFARNEEEAQQESDLWEAFKVFDEDGDGYISARELQVVLGKLGLVEGNLIDNVRRMIGSVDTNNDGRVDFYEFKEMMRATIIVPSS
ncbi:Calcium-binding protein CML42 [Spatholobus suberectus]|nr:Calcium-binding protein CML42 [Spatholobus suberectus]